MKDETLARTICLALALINQILAICGKERIPILEDNVYQIVSLIATIGTSLVAWWKNNSFTKEAIKADEYLDKLRSADYYEKNLD